LLSAVRAADNPVGHFEKTPFVFWVRFCNLYVKIYVFFHFSLFFSKKTQFSCVSIPENTRFGHEKGALGIAAARPTTDTTLQNQVRRFFSAQGSVVSSFPAWEQGGRVCGSRF